MVVCTGRKGKSVTYQLSVPRQSTPTARPVSTSEVGLASLLTEIGVISDWWIVYGVRVGRRHVGRSTTPLAKREAHLDGNDWRKSFKKEGEGKGRTAGEKS